jgi:hypothetical protein
MPSLPHRIHSQKWLIKASTAEDAFDIRKHLREQLDDTITPIFEKVFSEISPNGITVYINILELKVKVSSWQNLVAELPMLLEKQLLQKLTEVIQDSQNETNEARPGIVTEQENSFQQILYYLRTGSISWHSQFVSVGETLKYYIEIIPLLQVQLIVHLTKNVEHPDFYFRLLQLFNLSDIQPFIDKLASVDRLSQSKNEFGRIAKLLHDCTNEIIPGHNELKEISVLISKSLKSALNQELPYSYETEKGKNDDTEHTNFRTSSDLNHATSQNSITLNEKDFTQNEAVSPANVELKINADPDLNSLRVKGKIKRGSTKVFGKPDLPTSNPEQLDSKSNYITNTGNSFLGGDNSIESNPDNLSEDSPSETTVFQFKAEKITVFHSGLILLHPFLPQLFSITRILSGNKQQIPDHHLAKAAALLHFLATGEEDIHEFELGLVKLLLGQSPGRSLPVSAGLLLPADKEEADAVLQSAIEHWKILKKISIPGFRDTFIQRRGLLTQNKESCLLRIERMSFDLLLDHLPWSISVVKFPWMNQPILTEW